MNELYIDNCQIYFKTNGQNYDEAMDEFLATCAKADIDIYIENAELRNEVGEEIVYSNIYIYS